ncbi:hypothetical protein [Motiliproteus sp. SC1-56]|uniref:hypothetical protein n=1 Tax=Motiliproteus sp. SC1-56 TaxID=2799565 RepID=UPI001A8CD533|nr:hypothetical protein [Motiliproteus sp. SC1-56]
MIREYALNPDVVVSDINILQRFFAEFGADKGRVLVDVPQKWTDSVRQGVQRLGLKPVARSKCILLLERIKKQGVSPKSSVPMNAGDVWLAKVLASPAVADLHAILDQQAEDDPKVFSYLNMLGEAPEDWDLGQTESVERRAETMAAAVSTSLRLARTLHLVDPYFDPTDDRYRIPLLKFIEEIGKGRVGLKKLVVHTVEQARDRAAPKNRAEIERGLVEHVQPCLPAGFQVDVWIRTPNAMHDRFLLTDMVGYSFGHGLNEVAYQASLKVNINRLSEDGRSEQWKIFANPQGRIYEPLTVVGG